MSDILFKFADLDKIPGKDVDEILRILYNTQSYSKSSLGVCLFHNLVDYYEYRKQNHF